MSPKDKDLVLFAIFKMKIAQGKTLLFVNSVERCYRLKLVMDQFSLKAAVLNAELPQNSRQHIIDQFNRGVFEYLIATDESVALGGAEHHVAQDDDDDEEEEEEDDDDEEEKDDDEEDEDEDENEDGDEEVAGDDGAKTKSKSKSKAKAKAKACKGEEEFGVARGVDFYGVTTVINVDFPLDERNYTHRIGRTARGGASGVALSFIEAGSKAQERVLHRVQGEWRVMSCQSPIE